MTEEQQIATFGITISRMTNDFAESAVIGDIYDISSYSMAILSDAQEELSRGNDETARQYMNKAKYFMTEISKKARSQS